MTPRTSGTALGSGGGGGGSPASGALTLPPAKGAMPQSLGQGSGGGGGGGNAPNSPAVGLSPGALGPVRAQSPMAARRGSMPGSNSGLGSPLVGVGVCVRKLMMGSDGCLSWAHSRTYLDRCVQHLMSQYNLGLS